MMWFFAILIVLAMGAVAVVAAGHGDPMTQEPPERTPSGLPAAGRLSAEDLRTVRFPLAFRGYRMADVDALLDRLAAERDPAESAPETGGTDRPAG